MKWQEANCWTCFQRYWDVEEAQEILVPGEGMDVEEELREAFETSVACTAAREAKEQVAVNRPEAELPALGAAACARKVSEQQASLVARGRGGGRLSRTMRSSPPPAGARSGARCGGPAR